MARLGIFCLIVVISLYTFDCFLFYQRVSTFPQPNLKGPRPIPNNEKTQGKAKQVLITIKIF